jgi:hypothetical protein
MDMSRIGVQLARALSPEMYASAVQAGNDRLKAAAMEMVLLEVIASLTQELYEKLGVSEERINELIERAGHSASIKADLFVMGLVEAAGTTLDDSFIPHD